jgi:hypothetical protein
MLIDGHLRAETAPDAIVPVLILDVSEAEADVLLLTLDPLAAMAETDRGNLEALLASVPVSDPGVSALLARLAEDNGITPPAFEPVEEQSRLDRLVKTKCPGCGLEL